MTDTSACRSFENEMMNSKTDSARTQNISTNINDQKKYACHTIQQDAFAAGFKSVS